MRSTTIAIAAVLLAACSGSADSDPAPTESVVGGVTTDAPPDSVPVTTPSESGQPSPADKDIVTRSAAAVGEGVLPEGFATVTARVTAVDGEVCDVCLWLADDQERSGRGLMGVTDLGGPVGMAFVYDTPRDGAFFMFNTPTPLSIAWFSPSGDHVAQADMDPCVVDDSSVCQRYRPGAAYTVAIEMFSGQLDKVGIGPGSSIELLDLACD